MTVRRPHHWVADLDDARDDEAAMRALLVRSDRVLMVRDNTSRMDAEDFEVELNAPGGSAVPFRVEVKSKRQPYRHPASVWPEQPEASLFVLDELAMRRMFRTGSHFVLAVHDHPGGRWLYFHSWALLLGSKRRYIRMGDRGRGAFAKAKVLVLLTEAVAASEAVDEDALVRAMTRALDDADTLGAAAFGLPANPQLEGREPWV